MSELTETGSQGALRVGWTAEVDDYAIACEWALGGKVILVGDAAGGVHAFNGKSGAAIWEQSETHDGGLMAMVVHPGGKSFATAGQDGKVMIWNADNGEEITVLDLGSGWVEHLAWSLDGQSLAAASSRFVHVFSVDGQEIWQSEAHPSTVSAVSWSSTEELATACYGRVSFYNGATGELTQKLEWKGALVSMDLSPDGDIVACGSQDNSVHFWRRSTAKDSMMSGYAGKPSNLAFDRGGSLLATGGGPIVIVWCFDAGGPEGTRPGLLELHDEPVSSLAFAPRGLRLASGAKDGGIVLWALQSDGQGDAIGAALMSDLVSAIAWRPDGRILAAVDAKGKVTAWRLKK